MWTVTAGRSNAIITTIFLWSASASCIWPPCGERITMEELGELSGRFNYELACDLGKRIPRVYVKEGRVVATKDYYDDYR